VGQIYFGDFPAKWVRFTSALTTSGYTHSNSAIGPLFDGFPASAVTMLLAA
jgi:hypothetical protein